jgi:hypothetical protein
MIVVDRLKAIGYDMEIREGNIRLSYRGEGKPDKDKVVPLIEELKANKGEAIKELQKGKELIPDETLSDIYLKTMNEINDQYLEGTIKYIQDHHKELDTKIDEVDKQINEIWKSCLKGEKSIEDFNAALALYKNLYLEGIGLYGSKTEYKTGGIL